MIVNTSDPKNSTKEHIQLISIFSKVARYKINSNKSAALLYIDNKGAGKEIRETSLFKIATNIINILG